MKKLLKWGGIVLVVLLIIGALSGKSKDGNQGSTINSQSQQEVQPTPMAIEASILADAFDANQVAAESEWKGKSVQFDAEITNITDSGLSFSKVSSKEFSLTQISCRIKDKQQLLPLKNGETVTVKGVVGGQTIGVIDVNDCEVVQ